MAKCQTINRKPATCDMVDVAQLGRVGYQTALGWALRGLIHAERINGRWQADRASVERFLASREPRRPDLTPAA